MYVPQTLMNRQQGTTTMRTKDFILEMRELERRTTNDLWDENKASHFFIPEVVVVALTNTAIHDELLKHLGEPYQESEL